MIKVGMLWVYGERTEDERFMRRGQKIKVG